MSTHLVKGRQAEKRALKYLQRQGLKLMCKNYRCYFGEIDLIMRDQAVVVFVEVRFRSNPNFSSALESITQTKVHRICKTAWHYLRTNNCFAHFPQRFDIIAIESDLKIRWIKNAFQVY